MVLALQTAVPTLLRDQVVDILRNAITDCVFAPGGRLTERELCESLKVSRSTVREGLRQLEAEGLVTMTPNRGPMVALLSEQEAKDLYAIRATLEGMASAAAAERAEAPAIEALAAQVIQMRRARDGGDYTALQQAKSQFYGVIYTASGNPQLERMLRQMRARGTLLRGLSVFREARMDESLRGMTDVLAAVRLRDAAAAQAAAIGHIRRSAELALEAMRFTEAS